MEANDGLIGYSIDAYGVYSNHGDLNYDEFIRKISVEERDKPFGNTEPVSNDSMDTVESVESVESVEALSEMTISVSRKVCPKRQSRQVRKYFSALYTGKPMLTRGEVWLMV